MNDLSAPLIVCRYGKGFRYTLNPAIRRRGGPKWNAGFPSDWCEVPTEEALKAAAARAAAVSPAEGTTARIRQAHKLGQCSRRGGHWPKTDA